MIQLFNEDCIETMKRIPDGSIDLMLTDPPYGTTACEWDVAPNLAEMWLEWERILKPNGAWIFTASQPFTSNLVISRIGFFKYEWIWEKPKTTGHALSNVQPMKAHENILVFGRGKILYNPQIEKGIPYKGRNRTDYPESIAFSTGQGNRNNNDGVRFPRSVQKFRNAQYTDGQIHPTQKPVDLFRYLIKTYSNEGETVFDGYSGSATTAIACIKEKRNFIGSELNEEYYKKANDRINNEKRQLKLF